MAIAVAREAGFSQARARDLGTAVSEACLNAIEHGCRHDPSGVIRVLFHDRGDSLEVEVLDLEGVTGRGQMPADSTPNESGGWGHFLISRLVDEMTFGSAEGGGHLLRIVINHDRAGHGAGRA